MSANCLFNIPQNKTGKVLSRLENNIDRIAKKYGLGVGWCSENQDLEKSGNMMTFFYVYMNETERVCSLDTSFMEN